MDPYWLNLQQQNQQLPIVFNSSTPQYQTNYISQHSNIVPFPETNDELQSPNISNKVSETNELLRNRLAGFWKSQLVESELANEYKTHSLPLARIKKIMKSDGEVRMISAEAPVLLSRACDMFIQDLTLRSWVSTEECKRRTLQKGDISAALSTTDLFDFLVDIVPREKPILLSPSPPVGMPLIAAMSRNDEYLQHEQQLDEYNTLGGECSRVGISMGNDELMQQEGRSLSCSPHQNVFNLHLPDF